MRLAAESPYPGERDNALAAARRLAESHGMSLTEAARPEASFAPPPEPEPETATAAAAGRYQNHRGHRYQAYDYRTDSPEADWLRQHARAQREYEKEQNSIEIARAVWWATWIVAGLAALQLATRFIGMTDGIP